MEGLAARKVIGGYQDGTFQPDKGVTRAEFAKMLVVVLERNPDLAITLPFGDVKEHWAARMGFLQTAP